MYVLHTTPGEQMTERCEKLPYRFPPALGRERGPSTRQEVTATPQEVTTTRSVSSAGSPVNHSGPADGHQCQALEVRTVQSDRPLIERLPSQSPPPVQRQNQNQLYWQGWRKQTPTKEIDNRFIINSLSAKNDFFRFLFLCIECQKRVLFF